MDTTATFFSVFIIVLIILIFICFVWSIIWAYKDAESRGKSGGLVALLVLLVPWPIGLIIWLIFRPNNERRS